MGGGVMPVVFIDDKLHENNKILSTSGDGVKLWLVSLSWCNDKLTDGFIPKLIAPRLVPLRKPDKTIDELVAAPLWHLSSRPCKSCLELRAEKGVTDAPPSGGYLIHHYFHYQLPAHIVQARKATRATAGLEGARARWGDGKSHGKSDGTSYGKSHGKPDAIGPDSEAQSHSKPHGKPDAPYPVTPVPRTQSDSSTRARARDVDEPELPDDPLPDEPRGTARKSSQGDASVVRLPGPRHISAALARAGIGGRT